MAVSLRNPMRRLRRALLVASVVLSLPGSAAAVLIDFDSTGLLDGDAVGSIGVATFTAAAAVQGAAAYAFDSAAGDDTGFLAPFSDAGNIFITNPGGMNSADAIKTVVIDFSVPVSNVSFLAVDVDSDSEGTDEELVATAYDLFSNVLASVTLVNTGDGFAGIINFGAQDDIRRIEIELSNVGTSGSTNIGFGIDELDFMLVPEPATGSLFGLGLLALAVRRRRAARR